MTHNDAQEIISLLRYILWALAIIAGIVINIALNRR